MLNLQLFSGLIVLDSSVKSVAETYAEFMTSLQSFEALGQVPAAAGIQTAVVNHPQMGQTALATFVWSSPDHLKGREFLEKVLTWAPVAMQNVAEMSVPDWLTVLDAFSPYGIFGGDTAISFEVLSEDVLAVIGRHLEKMPSDPATSFTVHPLGRSSPSVTDVDLRNSSCFSPKRTPGTLCTGTNRVHCRINQLATIAEVDQGDVL
jgi:hypothetical protein